MYKNKRRFFMFSVVSKWYYIGEIKVIEIGYYKDMFNIYVDMKCGYCFI